MGSTMVRRWVCGVSAAVLLTVGLGALPAQADTAPVDTALPATVSADPLPTVQINGVVWKQEIVGGTVFVGGNFTSARPAGAPAGTNEVSRTHLLAYDLVTGVMIDGFAPVLNGQVKDLTVSPDQKTLYAVGQFTTVNGQNRYRIAAFDIATGALLSFRPTVNSTINAVAASSTAVYIGGIFTAVNGVSRVTLAAVSPANGATLPFAATLTDGTINAMTLAPDAASVVIGGSFTTVNGSSNPGYGLARLDATSGVSLPLPVNTVARNAGTRAAILSLESDGQNFYGTGYHFGGAGNVEGTFAADWATGDLVWMEDCHGDTYSAFPVGDVVYQASHKHYCGNSGGFPQTEPWSYQRGTAVTKASAGVNTPDIYGYQDHPGRPSPTFLDWYPAINAGSFTGKDQGPWTVSGNAQYVLMGGEFTQIGAVNQQGLVRFAVSPIAPNQQGPSLAGVAYPLNAVSDSPGSVRLTWRANRDPDNGTLTYSVYRETQLAEPIYRTTLTTPFWKPQAMTFLDTGLAPGSAQRYRLVAADAFGNQGASEWVTVTVDGSGVVSAYGQKVRDAAPAAYWRLGEPAGTTLRDVTGFDDLVSSTGVTRGAAGALTGDGDKAATFNGTTSGFARNTVATNAPDEFTVETWVRTTTTRGGKLVGFGNRATGTSTIADRHLYMDNGGRIHFGMQSSTLQTVSSPSAYNDGSWHHVAATYGAGSMRLYVDGAKVAERADVAFERSYWGYWRVGGDRLTSWPNRPASDYLAASLDEVAVYSSVLPAEMIAQHRTAGVTGDTTNRAPVAAFTATPGVLSVQVDASASADTDGTVTSYAWDFGDGDVGVGVTASHTYSAAGTYTVGLTVTDDDGAAASTTRQVVVTAPPAPGAAYAEDVFARTVSNGWGAADVGGAWTSTGLASRFSVDGQRGRHTMVAGSTLGSSLSGVSASGTDVQVTFAADKVPAGSGAFVTVQGRRVTATDAYGARVRLNADGSVQVHVTRGNGTPVTGGTVTGLTFAPNDQLRVRLQVEGTSPTTVRAKVWKVGQGEPAQWRVETTDSTASLQVPGGVGVVTYLFGSATNAPVVVSYDDLVAGPITSNLAPVAAFTAATSDLAVQVDGSGSSDADGSVASYAWDFGDGATASGATASHTYATAGTYLVSLTVTDDAGATGSTAHQVSVTAPTVNQPPVAAFTAATTDLAVQVDGSGSSDADGSVASYAWGFGDGATASGATAAHTFATAGTYTVSLTVTDGGGATGVTTQSVTVTAPVPGAAWAQDGFDRTVSGGWGAADVGGPWTAAGTASRFSVDAGVAVHTLPAGATTVSSLDGVSALSSELRVVVSADRVPDGSGAFVHLQGRRISATEYLGARLRLQADGSVQLHVTRNGSPLSGGTVAGLTFAATDELQVRLQVEGASPTTVRAKAWKVGTPEPADWRAQATDTTATLQVPGSIGISTYLFGSVTNGPVRFTYDDLWAGPLA